MDPAENAVENVAQKALSAAGDGLHRALNNGLCKTVTSLFSFGWVTRRQESHRNERYLRRVFHSRGCKSGVRTV
jgi:hypothetical protein